MCQTGCCNLIFLAYCYSLPRSAPENLHQTHYHSEHTCFACSAYYRCSWSTASCWGTWDARGLGGQFSATGSSTASDFVTTNPELNWDSLEYYAVSNCCASAASSAGSYHWFVMHWIAFPDSSYFITPMTRFESNPASSKWLIATYRCSHSNTDSSSFVPAVTAIYPDSSNHVSVSSRIGADSARPSDCLRSTSGSADSSGPSSTTFWIRVSAAHYSASCPWCCYSFLRITDLNLNYRGRPGCHFGTISIAGWCCYLRHFWDRSPHRLTSGLDWWTGHRLWVYRANCL